MNINLLLISRRVNFSSVASPAPPPTPTARPVSTLSKRIPNLQFRLLKQFPILDRYSFLIAERITSLLNIKSIHNIWPFICCRSGNTEPNSVTRPEFGILTYVIRSQQPSSLNHGACTGALAVAYRGMEGRPPSLQKENSGLGALPC